MQWNSEIEKIFISGNQICGFGRDAKGKNFHSFFFLSRLHILQGVVGWCDGAG